MKVHIHGWRKKHEGRKKQYVAHCTKTGQYFLLDTITDNGRPCVINFQDLTDEQFQQLGASNAWPAMTASFRLRGCRWCGSRKLGGCDCQRTKGKCPAKGTYSYQCLFCDRLLPVSSKRVSDVKNLRIAVTSRLFDNIGPLLKNMGLKTTPFSKCGFDCDMLFINCGTTDNINAAKLASFVREGGCLYISDLAIKNLEEAFPGAVTHDNNTIACSWPAVIEDPELRDAIGTHITVKFDMSVWARIGKHKGKCLIRGAGFQQTNPLMISFEEGKGKVYYTSFHNYAQASEQELAVLKIMLLRQIGSTVNQTISEISQILGLNISDLGNLARG